MTKEVPHKDQLRFEFWPLRKQYISKCFNWFLQVDMLVILVWGFQYFICI